MSLRPRDVPAARTARAGQRMAPGGRRWSESPIPRVGKRKVRRLGSAGLLYWWRCDDASGSVVEANGGPSLVVDAGTVTYHEDPLAPGSTHAIGIDSTTDASLTAEFTTGLGAGTDGLIVFDFWATLAADAAYWASHSSAEAVFSAYQTGGATGVFQISVGNSWTVTANQPAHLVFEIDHEDVYHYAGWPSPAHIRWKINLAGGSSRIEVNGVRKSTLTGLSFDWDPDDAWALSIGSTVATPSVFDEVKVYGSERTP